MNNDLGRVGLDRLEHFRDPELRVPASRAVCQFRSRARFISGVFAVPHINWNHLSGNHSSIRGLSVRQLCISSAPEQRCNNLGPLPESPGQTLALTVFSMPNSLDSG